MAQWLRRPTVTTNSNREIRSSILRGGVSFLHSFDYAGCSGLNLASSTMRMFSGAHCAWCVAGANYHVLALLSRAQLMFVFLWGSLFVSYSSGADGVLHMCCVLLILSGVIYLICRRHCNVAYSSVKESCIERSERPPRFPCTKHTRNVIFIYFKNTM